MVTPVSWNVLRQFDGGGLVIACDFSAAGRPIATFSDLACLLGSEFTMWETAPPPTDQVPGMNGEDHVERWLGDVRDSGIPVRAVLGFCSGCVYAGALAERISARQRTRLILLDPERADARMMLDFYDNVVTRAALSPAEVDDAVRAGRDAAAGLGLMALASRLASLCGQLVELVCARIGISPDRSAELHDLSVSYLYWLAAAGSLDPRAQWATATAVSCATPGVGLRGFPPDERAGLVANAIYLDVSHADLMRSPETARIADELLTAGEWT